MSGHDGQLRRPQASQRQLHNDFHILGKATSMRTPVELLRRKALVLAERRDIHRED